MPNIPDDVPTVLRALPPRTSYHVPSALLELWFPPGAKAGVIDDQARKAAEAFSAKYGCAFRYLPDRHEGVFWKHIVKREA